MKKKWNNTEIQFITQNYPISGSSNISLFLKRSKKSIEMMANKLALKLNSEVKKKIMVNSHKKDISKYSIPNEFNLSDPKQCYYLGYLWADGYIDYNNKSFGIEANKDDMIELYSNIFHMGKWNIYHRQRYGWKEQMNIKTTNPYLLNWLIKNDYHKKSEVTPDKLIFKIPIENRKYFILGLIDGDGCIYYNKKEYLSQVSITSTYDQDWSYIENFFKERNLKYKIKKTTKLNYEKYSQIRITNKSDVLKLCNELYENYDITKIGLKRKYLKFKEILNSTIVPHKRIELPTNRL